MYFEYPKPNPTVWFSNGLCHKSVKPGKGSKDLEDNVSLVKHTKIFRK